MVRGSWNMWEMHRVYKSPLIAHTFLMRTYTGTSKQQGTF